MELEIAENFHNRRMIGKMGSNRLSLDQAMKKVEFWDTSARKSRVPTTPF
jgi:hypothetical protein